MTALAEAKAARKLIARARVVAAELRQIAEHKAKSAPDLVSRIALLDLALGLTNLEIDLAGPMTEPTQEMTHGR